MKEMCISSRLGRMHIQESGNFAVSTAEIIAERD